MSDDALGAAVAHLRDALGSQVELDAPLGPLTTWRVGGPATALVRVARVEDLAVVAGALTPTVPRLVLGRGSNLLVADAGFAGIVLVLGPDFEHVGVAADPTGDTATVTAGGATPLPVLARRLAGAGWGGLEFYVGIPGSVGGAVRMNAGGPRSPRTRLPHLGARG
jgi:UDP-N-acetylmuramate dehydrogenase